MNDEIYLVETYEEFRSLEEEWNELADRLNNPLLRHDFFDAMVKAYDRQHQLKVLVVRSGGRICAIAPLSVKRSLGAAWLEFISHERHEPNGLLYADHASLERLVRGILKIRLPIVLNRLEADGAELTLFQAFGRGRWLFQQSDGGSVLRVPLSEGFASIEKAMSGSRRSTFRRRHKRAESFGQVAFVSVTPDRSNVDGYLDDFFRIEGSGWKGQGGSAILSDTQAERFFRAYGQTAAERGMLRLYLMTIDGVTVAARLAVAHAGQLWELKIGYDERWQACSPGMLLTHETLRFACEEGLAAHEFLGMSADWERIWPHEERQCRTLRCYPLALASIPYLSAESVRLARAFVERARP